MVDVVMVVVLAVVVVTVYVVVEVVEPPFWHEHLHVLPSTTTAGAPFLHLHVSSSASHAVWNSMGADVDVATVVFVEGATVTIVVDDSTICSRKYVRCWRH